VAKNDIKTKEEKRKASEEADRILQAED